MPLFAHRITIVGVFYTIETEYRKKHYLQVFV